MIIILGIVLAFNILIIFYKFTHDRIADAILDSAILITLASVFGGSTDSLTVASIASAIVSVYLFFSLKGK